MNKIALHSVPRSGSSWLGCIIDSSPNIAYRFQPLFSYGHKGALTPSSSLEDINDFYDDIYSTKDSFVLQQQAKENNTVPKFKKDIITHIAYKEVRYHYILENLLITDKSIKVVGLIRNPFSTIDSWLRAPKEFRKDLGWDASKEWEKAPSKNLNKKEEFNGYNKWKEVAFLFLKLLDLYPDRFYLVNYDDLILNRTKSIKKLFKFCNLEFSNQTQEFLENSKKIDDKDPYSVFKQKVDDRNWESTLPNFIIKEIKKDLEFQKLNLIFKWI